MSNAALADHAVIHVRAGRGGDGVVSFRREKYIPKGGPDGGDGGRGGSVIASGDENVQTLIEFRGQHHWKATNGGPGEGGNRHGKDGEDVVLRLPAGTLIFDAESGELLGDLRHGDELVVARGGEGGLGNSHFKSATNQVPRQSTEGEEGQERSLRLELKLIADIGLVGMPNAGKSTFLAASTRARPKVADYPFTTLLPQLGIAELDAERRLVIADIPGLIEGAAQGAGLGHDFLRHIERTRVLVHVLDALPMDGSDPAENYTRIRKELFDYSPVLAEKDEIVALNKLDLLPEEEREGAVRRLRSRLNLGAETPCMGISGATGAGVRELLDAAWKLVELAKPRTHDGWGRPVA